MVDFNLQHVSIVTRSIEMRMQAVSPLIGLLLLSPSGVWAVAEKQPTLRARPPEWSTEVNEVFFVDARKHLSGERPQPVSPLDEAARDTKLSTNVQKSSKWSALIEADTLTTEVKRIHNQLGTLLARPGAFKSGGHADCRRNFSLLALLFGVAAEYDQEVRWQPLASRTRALCSQAAKHCEQPSDKSFALATEVHAQIAELLSGQMNDRRVPNGEEPIDRGQLMLSMELTVEEKISPRLASQKDFRRRRSEVAHESQLLAVLARTICRVPYDYADDVSFVELAREMQRASRQLTKASHEGAYEAARQAAGRVTRSCSECHDVYRE